MARRPLFWRQLALIGASVFFLCLLASFLSPSEAHPPAQDGTPTPVYLPLVFKNYPPPATVYVVSSSTYTDTNTLYVVGEVINNTSGNVSSVRVTCALRNAGGDVVRTEYAYTMIDVLAPGQKAPFGVGFHDYPDYASYDLTVTYSSTSQSARTGVSVLSSDSWTDPLISWLYIVGEVQNNTTGNVGSVKVVVTYYDASGKVTNAHWTSVLLHVLGPGQKGPFKILTENRPYSSYVFSVEYWPTSDPATANVPVLNSSTWSEYSSLYIVGEVQNDTSGNIEYVRVIATFYDSSGQVTNVDWNYLELRLLSTGKKACFKIWTENRPYSSYNLATGFTATTYLPPNLQVLSVTPSGDLHLAGEIRNNDSTNTYNSVEAIGTLYDSVGKVLNCEYSYTSPFVLGPGSTAPYDIYFSSHTTGWTTYTVDTTGYPPPHPTATPVPP